MKAFIASVMIMLSLGICSVINCIYIDKITSELLELESVFPSKSTDGKAPASQTIETAYELWQKSMPRLLCTVKASYINAITLAIENTRDFYLNGSSSDYNSSRSLLVEALKVMQASDSLKLTSII